MSVKSTLLAAYLLGRSEHPVSEEMLDGLVSKLDDDVVRLETEVAVLKRKVDDLRRENEVLRHPSNVVAMRKPDANGTGRT
jgi:hypothetical protein